MVYQAFVYTLLHSIWQAALLALVYWLGIRLHPSKNARQVKQVTAWLMILPFAFSLITFFYLLSDTGRSPMPYEANPLHIPASVLETCTWIYLSLVAIKSTQLAIRWNRYVRLLRKDTGKAPIDWRLFVQQQSALMGIRQWVQVKVSPHIATVTTYGFWRPVILIPLALANQLTLAQAESLLLHELAHIRQNDYLWNWVILVTERLYFFNPFVLYLCNGLREEREFACDETVLHWQQQPITYAESLLLAARHSTGNPVFAMAATGQKEQLLERIQYITGTSSRKRNLPFTGKRFTWTTLTGLLLITIGFHRQLQSQTKVSPKSISAFRQNSLHQHSSTTTAAALPMVWKYTDLTEPDQAVMQPIAEVNRSGQHSNRSIAPNQVISTEAATTNTYAVAASFPEKAVTATNDQILIMEEENPATGIKVTQAYRVFQEKGEWKSTLLWSMLDSKPAEEMPHATTDSCSTEKIHD